MYYEELETISQSVSNGKKETQKETIKIRITDVLNEKLKSLINTAEGELEIEVKELNTCLENSKNKLNSSMHSKTAIEIENKIISLKNDTTYVLDFDTKETQDQKNAENQRKLYTGYSA